MDTLMPTFDPEIRRLAERLLIKPRAIDSRVGVFASEVIPGIPGVKPVTIKMIDAKTKEHVETLEVDACLVATGRVPNTVGLGLDKAGIETDRGFISVDEHMRVQSKKDGSIVPNLYCIGDANGKMVRSSKACMDCDIHLLMDVYPMTFFLVINTDACPCRFSPGNFCRRKYNWARSHC